MNHQRATNTVAFAIVMLSIFFSQVKAPVEKAIGSYQVQAAQIVAKVHQISTTSAPEQVDFDVMQAKLRNNQAKLACAHELLRSKMETLGKVRESQAAARLRVISYTEDQADPADWQ